MSHPTTTQAQFLTHRAKALAQQFQTIAQNITACDIKSSNYPRLVNLLLKLHKALQEFDFNPAALPIQNPKSEIQNSSSPAALPEDSTKTAPTYDLETDSTISAPTPSYPGTEHSKSIRPDPSTISAPESPSTSPPSLSIQNLKSKIQNSESPLQERRADLLREISVHPCPSAVPPLPSKIQNSPEQELKKIHQLLDEIEIRRAS